MPLLNRQNPNGTRTEQQLLIWRDIHSDIKTISKITDVINEYQPDTIILECPPEGTSLKLYISSWRKFGITNSYAFDTAVMMAINQKIPIVLSDYRGPTRSLLQSAAQALDMYCVIPWSLLTST
eukprot:804387_1